VGLDRLDRLDRIIAALILLLGECLLTEPSESSVGRHSLNGWSFGQETFTERCGQRLFRREQAVLDRIYRISIALILLLGECLLIEPSYRSVRRHSLNDERAHRGRHDCLLSFSS